MNERVQGCIADTLTSAGKHICEAVFLGRQWFHVSSDNGKRFREHG